MIQAISPLQPIESAPSASLGAVQMAQAPASAPAFATAPGAVPAVGNLSNATPGVEIVRDGQRIAVQGSVPLQMGDRVLVPDGGQAAVAFAGSSANAAPLTGVLAGGSDATITTATLANGMRQVTVDLAAGDLAMAAAGSAEAASLVVKKPAAALAGSGGLGGFALGALGLGATTSMLDDDDNPVDLPLLRPATPPGSGDSPLDPTTEVVTDVVDSLDDALGLGGALAPVAGLLAAQTDLVNELLAPAMGGEFHVGNPNALDPLDGAVASVGHSLTGALEPLLDGLPFGGAAAGAVGAIATQVDYLTDGVVHLVDKVVLGDAVDAVLGGTPVAGLVHGLVGEQGLLGSGSLLDGWTTGLLGADGPVGGLLGGDLLGGMPGGGGAPGGGDLLLNPSWTLGGVAVAQVSGMPVIGDALGDTLAPGLPLLGDVATLGSGLLAPVLGDTFTADSPNMLDPVDGVAGSVADTAHGLVSPVVDAVLGAGATSALLAPVVMQVDYVTDGVARLLGDDFLEGALPGVLPTGDLLNGDLLSDDLLSGDLLSDDLLSGDLLSGDLLSGDLLSGDLVNDDLLNGDLPGVDIVGGLLGGDALAGAGGDLAGDLLGDGAFAGSIAAPLTSLLPLPAGDVVGAAPVPGLLQGLVG